MDEPINLSHNNYKLQLVHRNVEKKLTNKEILKWFINIKSLAISQKMVTLQQLNYPIMITIYG